MMWPFRKKRKRHSFLTKRQTEVLKLMARGLSNKEIGYEVGISEQTVKNHVSNIMRQMEVFNRTEAVVEAVKRGIVKL